MANKGQGRAPLAFLLYRWRRHFWQEARINRAYPAWLRAHAPDMAAWRARVAALPARPQFSIIMPTHDTPPAWLAAAVGSVVAQIYPHWELRIADDASASPATRRALAALPKDPRIHIRHLPAPAGISAASNAALSEAAGEYVAFLDHDDLLAPHALAAMAAAIAEDPARDVLFSDEDQLIAGRRAAPYFKPGWNPDLLLSQNCVGHVAVYRRALLLQAGGLRPECDGSQDWDLALRVTAGLGPARIHHVPDVLYTWRQSAGSLSAASAARCAAAGRHALRDHLGGAAGISADPALPQWPVVRFAPPVPHPLVSLIGAAPPTGYAPVEHVADEAAARGEVLVVLPRGVTPLAPDWLEALVGQACRPGIAAACPRILRRGEDPDDPGYRGLNRLPHTIPARGAAYAMRRGATGRVVLTPHALFQSAP